MGGHARLRKAAKMAALPLFRDRQKNWLLSQIACAHQVAISTSTLIRSLAGTQVPPPERRWDGLPQDGGMILLLF